MHIRLVIIVLAALVLGSCSASSEPDPNAMDVLLVGNSYTYFNDMPEMVESIAAANGASLNVTMIATGGYRLADHVQDGEAAEAITSGKYEVVVFQEQSVLPSLSADLRQTTLPAAIQLDQVADNAGVRVVWYQTWGREDGLSNAGFGGYDDMQAALVDGYSQIADSTGGELARVGESWQRVLRSGTGLDLYSDDGSHPSPLGSYVAALEIAETIMVRTAEVAPGIGAVDEASAAAILAFG